MMRYLLIFFLLGSAVFLRAQDCHPLESNAGTDDFLSGLLNEDKKIEGACLLAQGDDFISIRVDYGGFDDKEYRIVGRLLDANKRPLNECEPVAFALERGATSTDLQFAFLPGKKAYTEPYVPVSYLSVVIAEADDPLAELDLGGLSVFGTKADYRLDHAFRVGGNSAASANITIQVALTPVKRAATIKP
jgi:hypothetical protein